MKLAATPVTVISGVRRSGGWRAQLRDGRRTVWRCHCQIPHPRPELASACANEALGRRDSGFYVGGHDMDEWLPVPQTDAERNALAETLHRALSVSEVEAGGELRVALDGIMQEGATYESIRRHQGATEGIKSIFHRNREIREQAERVYLAGEWRIGKALVREEKDGLESVGGRPKTVTPELPVSVPATLAEKVGNKMYGWRLKQIAPLALEALHSLIKEHHQKDKEATLTGVVKLLRADESRMRRWDSLTTPAIDPSVGMDLRICDCREAFNDIPDASIPLIMTDPPYELGARLLWEWLAAFAHRVLMPGGSLICYFGGAHINLLYRIFDDAGLVHHFPAWMHHHHAQKLGGKWVIANGKPVAWYVKEFRRGRILVPNEISDSVRDKSSAEGAGKWAQGDGGVRQWIHQLTDPGETILDPFAGTARWGYISCEAGRNWIGSDIVAGGTTTVMTEEGGDE